MSHIFQKAFKYASTISYSTIETLQNTADTVHYAVSNNIKGDLVECGVAAGAQVIVAAAVLEMLGSDKKIYCFDSFQGISLASHHDTVQAGVGPVNFDREVSVEETLKSSGVTACPLEHVKQHILAAGLSLDRFVFIEGWVENTLPVHAKNIDSICWFRTDMDQYYPTKYSMDHLFPLVTVGAPVIIDDYALTGCRKAVDEYLAKYYESQIMPEIKTIPKSDPVYFYKKYVELCRMSAL